jgi:DNA polymerase sigma
LGCLGSPPIAEQRLVVLALLLWCCQEQDSKKQTKENTDNTETQENTEKQEKKEKRAKEKKEKREKKEKKEKRKKRKKRKQEEAASGGGCWGEGEEEKEVDHGGSCKVLKKARKLGEWLRVSYPSYFVSQQQDRACCLIGYDCLRKCLQ